jgi:hypothetical protein
MWDSATCIAAGPLVLDYRGVDDVVAAAQRRGMALLLREALARGLPVILTCHGGASVEADLAALALSALAAAPPPRLRTPAPRPWKGCTPLLCYDAGGLWERLHIKWPWCAWAILDGSVTFGKAPRELTGLAFDVPLERLLLASAAPRHLPAQAGGAGDRRTVCHSGHVVFTAERIATLKTTSADSVEAARVLESSRESARLLFPALGLQWRRDAGMSAEDAYRAHHWGEELR